MMKKKLDEKFWENKDNLEIIVLLHDIGLWDKKMVLTCIKTEVRRNFNLSPLWIRGEVEEEILQIYRKIGYTAYMVLEVLGREEKGEVKWWKDEAV